MKNTTEKTKNTVVVDDDHNDRILWDCGSPLYDSYELVSLTHIIERHFMSLPSLAGTGKMYYSRTPLDLGEKSNRAASAVVDLCCSSASTDGNLLWGIFQTKWWKKRSKNAEAVVDNYKKKKNMFCRILSGTGNIRIPTTRSRSSKM